MTYTLSNYVRQVAFWMLPAFFVWWIALQPVILPALAGIQNSLLQTVYKRARAELNSDTPTDWYIRTRLIHPQKAPSGNPQMWNTRLGNLDNLTLGLPLVWMLLLASPTGRLRKTLLATVIVALLTALAAWLRVNHFMLALLTGEQAFQVYVTGTIRLIHQPVPAWLTAFSHIFTDVISYVTVIAVPALLAYRLNRDWWQQQWSRT